MDVTQVTLTGQRSGEGHMDTEANRKEVIGMSGQPKLSPTCVIDVQDSTISVLETERGRLMLTNPVGAKILQLCDGTHTVEEIAAEVAAEFPGAEVDEIRTDVEEFLTAARGKGVIAG
jgi:hypothetical protein